MTYLYKKNKLINIAFTTASVGVLTSGLCEMSFAELKNTVGGAENLSMVGVAFSKTDTLRYDALDSVVTAQVGGPTGAVAIDVNTQIGGKFIVNGLDFTVGSIMGGGTLDLEVATGNTLTFTGASGLGGANAVNNYSGASTVTLNNSNATLKVAAAGMITLDTVINGNGKLEIDSSGGNVILNGAIGNVLSLSLINTSTGNNAVIFNDTVSTTAITTGDGSVDFTNQVTATAGKDLTITTGAGNLSLQNVTGALTKDIIFTVGGGGSVTANGVSSNNGISIDTSNHAVIFNSTTTTANNGNIVVGKANKQVDLGIVNLDGTGTLQIGTGVGGVKASSITAGDAAGGVKFTGAGQLILGGAVTGTLDAPNGGTIVLAANSTITEAVTGKDMIFVLNNNTLTLDKGGIQSGDIKIMTNITGVPGTQGNISVTNGTLDMTGATKIAIEITNSAGYTPGVAYPIIAATGTGGVDFGPITPTVIDASPLVTWIQYPSGVIVAPIPFAGGGGGGFVLPILPMGIPEDELVMPVFNRAAAELIADFVMKEVFGTPGFAVNADHILSILDLDKNTGQVAQGIYQLTVQIGGSSLVAALVNITAGGITAYIPFSSSAPEAHKLQGVVGNRIDGMSLIQVQAEGIPSGDETKDQKYGAWTMGFGSKGEQKSFGVTNGYKDKMLGAVIGADTKLNDSTAVGFAVMHTESNVFHKGIKAGDKTKIPTLAMSLYGVYEIKNNWFVHSDVMYSDSNIHDNSKRVIGGNVGSILWGVAESKYHSKSVTINLSSRYNYVFCTAYSITPSVGVSYIKGRDNAYKETGAGAFNYSFNKKEYSSTSGIVGMKLTSHYAINGFYIAPELRTQVRTRLYGKDPIIISNLEGQATSFISKSKSQRTSYSVGVGVNVKRENVDFTVGYDTQISKKYLGHSGALKVRINL